MDINDFAFNDKFKRDKKGCLAHLLFLSTSTKAEGHIQRIQAVDLQSVSHLDLIDDVKNCQWTVQDLKGIVEWNRQIHIKKIASNLKWECVKPHRRWETVLVHSISLFCGLQQNYTLLLNKCLRPVWLWIPMKRIEWVLCRSTCVAGTPDMTLATSAQPRRLAWL